MTTYIYFFTFCFISPLDAESHKLALDSLKDEFADSPTAYGGPMMQEEFSIVHSFGEVEGSMKLCNGVYIGGYEELVDEVKSHRCDPRKCLFVKGHASWGPGQLSDEIAQGVWYAAAASSDLILRLAGGKLSEQDNYDDLWGDLMKLINTEENCNSHNHFITSDHGRSDARVFYSE
jgi:putative transcriptional regulator